MTIIHEEPPPIPVIEPNCLFEFPEQLEGIRLNVQWTSKQQGIICDLELNAFMYDERARYSEKVDASNKRSKDESCVLIKDVDNGESSRIRTEFIKIDFRLVNPTVSAIVIFLDGGPRNFQYLQSVSMECSRVLPERAFGDFLPKDNTENNQSGPLFQISGRTRKTYKGLVMCVFYKDGWWEGSETPKWMMRCFLEPVYVSSIKDKQERCTQLVIAAVPALEKFRPRLFGSVREICAALSSHSLPKLKKKFQRTAEGLPIGQFTDVIFKQLYETHPRIVEEAEAAYTVALLQEMFQQIDYNGDGSTNWDEFTTFCVQTGLNTANSHKKHGNESGYSLDQYVIEYGEEVLHRDHVLSAYRMVAQMRHVPETRKLLVIPEDSDNVMILDEKFRVYTQLYPNKVQVIGSMVKKAEKGEKREKNANDSTKDAKFPRAMIYDAVYLTGREMYAYSSSDHSITICRELTTVSGGKVNFLQHNRFYHNLLHLKLCWSGKHDILCSTASDRVIYGWNIDTSHILFQVSRHADIITDFIAVDHLDMFITCSMDKRIVMWSAVSRRVKGVLLGHKRGVRSLSVYENTMLSAGFECEAKTWDIANKNCVAILKGHRHPIVAAKLMCEKAQSEKEHRAITVDESGEFRLWNIFVRERASEPVPVPTLQIFEMQNSEHPLNQFRFLAMPYTSRSSTSYYSNLIACSTKLLHFIPEKNTKEFVPPTALVCHEAAASLVTAVGKNVLMYDLASGAFDKIFEGVATHDIFSICMDGERGRRMYLGTSAGQVILINSINGAMIDTVSYHSKEITCIAQKQALRTSLFSCSMDGHLRVYEESVGKIHLQNSVDNVFGEGVGLAKIKVAPSVGALVVSSAAKVWGILNDTSFKKLLIIHEPEVITAIEVVGASRDNIKDSNPSTAHSRYNMNQMKEHLLTLAVALTKSISIYVLDITDLRGIKSYELLHDYPIYVTDMLMMKGGDNRSVNYSSIRTGQSLQPNSQHLIACTDDGKICVWEIGSLRTRGEERFREHYAAKQGKHQRKERKKHSSIIPEVNNNVNNSPTKDSKASSSFITAVEPSDEEKAAQTALLFQANRTSGARSSRESLLNNAATSWLESLSKDIFPLAVMKENTQNINNNILQGLGSSSTSSIGGGMGGGSRASILVNNTKRRPPPTSTNHIIMSEKGWSAHGDTIPSMVCLQSHACFVTVSHDGYHRVWNLDSECLGEHILPNITEHMKSQSLYSNSATTQWKFILERIPVSKQHTDIANVLIKNIKQSRGERFIDLTADRRQHFNIVNFKGFAQSDEEGEEGELLEEENVMLRKAVLKSLLEPPKFSEEPPPSRLPTKEEKELIKLAFAGEKQLGGGLENDSFVSPPSSPPTGLTGSLTLNEKTVSTTLNKLKKPRPRNTNMQETSIRSSLLFNGDSSVCLSSFGVPSLWYVPGEKDIFGKSVQSIGKDVPQAMVPPAFSEASLAALHREGLIDVEGHRILRNVANKPDRVQVYDRSQPTLLIRSPSMSTSVSLPPLESVRKTEIAFGAQKDMYKNAEKLLQEKDKLSAGAIRNAVAMARLESNVRKVHTMVHLIQPPTHDEVILPRSNEREDEEGVRSEEARMQLRLLKSAALVPLEAKEKARPLDRGSIDRWLSKMKSALEVTGDGGRGGAVGIGGRSISPLAGLAGLLSGGDGRKSKKKKREVLSAAAILSLEKKLYLAIRGEYRSRMALMAKRKQDAAQKALQQLQQEGAPSGAQGQQQVKDLLAQANHAQEILKADSNDEEEHDSLRLTPHPPLGTAPAGSTLATPAIVVATASPGTAPGTAHPNPNPNPSSPPTPMKKALMLTTRQLLPYYKLEAVHQFMDIFAKVDENFSGDLDVNEWIKLFTSLNASVPVQEARMIFLKIDKDNDGHLSMRELIPVVFSKASREQQKLIIQYCEMELTKKVESETVPKVTITDLEFLFEAYDAENVGFVDVALIKERVKSMGLSEPQLYFFLEIMGDLADDDMVNLAEFKRLFRSFTSTK